MRKSYLLSALFILFFFTCQIFSQDDPNKWSLKLIPSGDKVPLLKTPEVKMNPDWFKPMRQVTKDRTYVIYPNIMPKPTNGTGSQSEMSIAVNPNNPNIILIGSNAANTAVTYLNQGWYVSTNQGQTWYGNDSLPNKVNTYRSDPVVGFDLNGNMFFNTLDYGSTAGDVVTLKSTNNGLTWLPNVAVPNPGIDEDKNWMAIDQDPTSPYANYIYTSYTEFQSGDPNYYRLEFSRSTDGGATFSAPIRLSGSTGYLDQGVNLACGPGGVVYATWTNYQTTAGPPSNLGFAKSTNGGVSFTTPTNIVSNIVDFRSSSYSKGGQTIRVNSFPQISVDMSNGPRRGWVYIVYAARPASGQSPDVYLVKSTNGGTNWLGPKRVNADSALTNRDQFFPSVEVDPADGSVNIIYYDSRNFAANDSAEIYMSRSIDGGETFEDIKISTSAFLLRSIPGLATGYFGDYIEVTAKNGIVWPCWNDNRTGQHQAWTAKVFFIQINHDPITNTENLAGPYLVKAAITGSLPITEAKVFWRRGTSGAFDSLLMTRVGTTDTFTANIPGNNNPATYNYYIYAKDQVGSFATLPGGAPTDVFSFVAATDLTPPTITHTVLGNQYREVWPATVSATVTDNIGVDSVRVNYRVKWNGTPRQFYLTKGSGNVWSGVFNIDTTLLAVGDTIYYRITARDKAAAGNYAYHPSATTFNTFRMIADTEFPVITHTALRDQPRVRWPAQVQVVATDNIAVDSVWVEWYKNTTANSRRFNLTKGTGDNWSGLFNSDTTQVAVGDSIFYRVVARDRSTNRNITYLPATGRFKFNIIQTKGFVLVVDDDVTLEHRFSPEKGSANLTAPLGASANLFKTTLDSVGYIADLVTFAALDTNTLNNYDIVILSAGPKSSTLFNDAGKRDAIRNFASKPLKKTWVEGGEVGYFFRSTGTNDQLFRQQVLFTEAWVSDASTGILNKKRLTHPINTTPNAIPDNLSFTGSSIYDRDAMRVLPGASVYPVSTWSSFPDSGGIIVRDKNPNPVSADNIFYTFNIGVMIDQASAKKLIENTAEYLMAQELAPTGKITGTVTLTGAPNSGGVVVNLTGMISKTTTTASNGTYSFDSLYAGAYRVTAVAPSGYFPYSAYKDTTVGTTTVSGINFNFVPIQTGTVTGNVAVVGAPDNSGVLVEIMGQTDKTATTNAAGNYTITGVNPGQILVRFSKSGYGPKIKDTTLANGGTTVVNMTLFQTLGTVLIINDDLNLTDRINPERAAENVEFDLTSPLGASANLIKAVLDSLGYSTTLVNFADFDTTQLVNYQLAVLSAGAKTSAIFNDAGKRNAIRNWHKTIGKVWSEGGELGYFFRSTSTTADSLFRKEVLHVSRWISDVTSSTLNIKAASHPINTTPHAIPSNIAFTGTGVAVRDAMRVEWDPQTVYPTNTWSATPDSGGIVVYDRNSNPVSADAVFYTFNLSLMTDQTIARKLVENTARYLFAQEAAPTGSIAGTITLTGAPNNSGAKVYLGYTSGMVIDSVTTGNPGTYTFANLYPGLYRITVIPPTGFFPQSAFRDTTVGTGPVTGVNFTFSNILPGTVTGTVTVTGAPDNSGVLVEVLGQTGKTATTNAAGSYTISNVTPGNISVRFSKTGFSTKQKDTTLANGGTTIINMTIIPTLGNVLIVDDDVTLMDRISPEKMEQADLTTPLGASATLFKNTLDAVAFNTTLVTFAALDTNQLANYDIVILSAGPKSSNIFNDQGKRDALRNFANKPNKKVWTEGGEVGYFFRNTNTAADSLFRKQILHTSVWVSDASSSTLNLKLPTHPINSVPNTIPDNIAFTGTSIYTRDAMRVDWDPQIVYPTNVMSAFPDSGGIIVFDKNPNPISADAVFFTFQISMITDQTIAQKLIENTAKYLIAVEPPPTGGVAGTVTLTGNPDNSGAKVYLYKLPSTVAMDSITTPASGSYSFGNLYASRYRVKVVPPTIFYPSSAFVDTTIGTTVVSGINFTFGKSLSFSTIPGWNLVSVPVKQTNMSKGSLFPQATSNAFAYDDNLGYQKKDSLALGYGYWLKFGTAQTHTFQGSATMSLDVPVSAGWNLIGGLHGPIPTGSITSTPPGIVQSQYFEFGATGYNAVTSLDKGKGYFVRTNNAGTLRLTVPVLAKQYENRLAKIDNSWPTILITDARGIQSKLYFGADLNMESLYDLPPVPPAGAYDVRFASDRFAEKESQAKFTVLMNSLEYPVSVRVLNTEDKTFRIKDGINGKLLSEILSINNEVVINNPAINIFTLQNVEIPTEFELSQNYPNPFNPITTIKFALPENAKVTLRIYNSLGEKVADLIDGEVEAGYYSVTWPNNTKSLSSGVYFYELNAGKFRSIKKMMLVK